MVCWEEHFAVPAFAFFHLTIYYSLMTPSEILFNVGIILTSPDIIIIIDIVRGMLVFIVIIIHLLAPDISVPVFRGVTYWLPGINDPVHLLLFIVQNVMTMSWSDDVFIIPMSYWWNEKTTKVCIDIKPSDDDIVDQAWLPEAW